MRTRNPRCRCGHPGREISLLGWRLLRRCPECASVESGDGIGVSRGTFLEAIAERLLPQVQRDIEAIRLGVSKLLEAVEDLVEIYDQGAQARREIELERRLEQKSLLHRKANDALRAGGLPEVTSL